MIRGLVLLAAGGALALGAYLVWRRPADPPAPQATPTTREAPGQPAGAALEGPSEADAERTPLADTPRRAAPGERAGAGDGGPGAAALAEMPSDAELERQFGALDKPGLRAAFEQREHLMNTYGPGMPIDDDGTLMTRVEYDRICREYSFLKTKLANL